LKNRNNRDADAAHGEHAEDRLGFGIAKVRHDATLAPGQKMGREIQRRQDLEHRQDQLDGQRIEVPDAGVVGGEAAERERRKSVTDGVEPIHPGKP
jgi:hypothetical protein